MLHPNTIKQVTLDGHSLTLEAFVAAARFGAAVSLAPAAAMVSFTFETAIGQSPSFWYSTAA